MLLKEAFSREYLTYLLNNLYYDKYSDVINNKIRERMEYDIDLGLTHNEVPSEIAQFYHEYKLIKNELDYYKMFKEELIKIYNDLNKRNIVDVCAGMVPQLAKELAKETTGKVIAVDRYITSNNDLLPNLKNVRGEFNNETTLSNQDLIIGLHPCDATLDIVKKASEYDIDFAIAICDCYINNSNFKKYEWFNLKNRIEEVVENSNLGNINYSNIGLSPLIYTNKSRR